MKIPRIYPDSILKKPSLLAGGDGRGREEDSCIGKQNGVDAGGVVVGDDLESQTEQADKFAEGAKVGGSDSGERG